MKAKTISIIALILLALVLAEPLTHTSAASYPESNWMPRSVTIEVCEFSPKYERTAKVVTSYLTKNIDGSITSINASDEDAIVRIETTGRYGQQLAYQEISYELPMFGAYYCGEEFNYIVFGQNYPERNKSKDVLCIVKYNKNFERIDALSLEGGFMWARKVFDAGTARLAENGNILILHTCCIGYDGHQRNVTTIIDKNSMELIFYKPIYTQNYVSHSFDQYIFFDGDTPVYVDHCDAMPERSVILHKGHLNRSIYVTIPRATMFAIPGEIGANMTGVTVGGAAMSSSSYIMTITSVDHSKVSKYTNFEMEGLGIDQRDIITCTIPRDFSNGAVADKQVIARYIGTDMIATTPLILSNGDNTFVLFWQEYEINDYARKKFTPGVFVAQDIDALGRAIGERREYNSADEFYAEFLDVCVLPGRPSAIDTASGWAHSAVVGAMEKGYVQYDPAADFKDVITRAEFCEMAIRFSECALGDSIDGILASRGLARDPVAFTDTDDSDILAALALGITNGVRPGLFDPEGQITREQAATLVRNVCRIIGLGNDSAAEIEYIDAAKISPWAVDGIVFCNTMGLMGGTGGGRFSPKASLTIQESIVVFERISALF